MAAIGHLALVLTCAKLLMGVRHRGKNVVLTAGFSKKTFFVVRSECYKDC